MASAFYMLTLALEPPFALSHQSTSLGGEEAIKGSQVSVSATARQCCEFKHIENWGCSNSRCTSTVRSLAPTSMEAPQPRCLGCECQEDMPWLEPHGKRLLPLGKVFETADQGLILNWGENLFVNLKQCFSQSCGNIATRDTKGPAVYDYCFVVNF